MKKKITAPKKAAKAKAPKVAKKRATHNATLKSKTPTGKSDREIQAHQEMEQLKAQKEDLALHPEKQRELGVQQKEKYDAVEKEIAQVLANHDIPMQAEFMVQIRSWFLEARNQNVPPEMREGPGVALPTPAE